MWTAHWAAIMEKSMAFDFKKEYREFYLPKNKPEIVTVPKMNYIAVRGKGNPNEEDFSNRISALYSVAYGIKMLFKKAALNNEINDFTVFPLEGLWQKGDKVEFDKNDLSYILMIKQPSFITEEIYKQALEIIKQKKPNDLYEEIAFKEFEEEKAIQILHLGSFDDEPQSFEKMDKLATELQLKRTSNVHLEIYLTNKNRTSEEKQKTILRYSVE